MMEQLLVNLSSKQNVHYNEETVQIDYFLSIFFWEQSYPHKENSGNIKAFSEWLVLKYTSLKSRTN